MNGPVVRPSVREMLRLWFASWLLLLCTAFGNLDSVDAAITMHAAHAAWVRGDSGLRPPDADPQWLAEGLIAGEIRRLAIEEHKHVNGKVGRDGRLVYAWFPIGHVWMMVPFVAIGGAVGDVFPTVEATYRERAGERWYYGMFVCEQAAAAMLPSLCGATSIVLLWLLGLALGGSRRDALAATLAIVVATQFLPACRETISDGPGLMFLLGALLAAVRASQGDAGVRTVLLGGAAAGAAVLTRTAHAPLLLPLGLAIGAAAWRHRRWSLPVWFAAGGLPFAVLFLWANHSRFGDPFDTGYPPAAAWFNYPLWAGLTKLLIAAGKGILWFSPLLWLALPLAVRRRDVPSSRWLAWTLFAVPLLMFGRTLGWQSGQCWGARYVTPGVVALLAIVLPQARPWRRWPRTFGVLVAVGAMVNVTGLVAPTRGYNWLADQAVQAMYDQQLQRGEIGPLDRANVDPPDHYFFLPRFSPLHANWTYAWRSLTGGFEDRDGRRLDGAANTTLPLFGIDSTDPMRTQGPLHWEDRGMRHLWFVFWSELTGAPWWLLPLPPLLLGAWLLRSCWRRTAPPFQP